ncbi:hypothetical protein [Mesoflavibacter sp. CH_XMU1422-2]|uniref:hypothetical protein n=1 Tax=Mesoflavibacter sp. CH_XMU1422-2 TaxID=3107770 RepID=UPI003008E325
MKDKIRLQPLRVEAGWAIKYNQFYEVDPLKGNESFFEGSSLLMLEDRGRLKLIDVQWRPERNLDGKFQLEVLNFLENYNPKTNELDKDVDWENPFYSFSTKNRLELVEKLEKLMYSLPVEIDSRILIKRGEISEPSESYRLILVKEGISKKLVDKIIKNGNAQIQNLVLDQPDITRKIILNFSKNGVSKKVKNKAKQKLTSKRFKE